MFDLSVTAAILCLHLDFLMKEGVEHGVITEEKYREYLKEAMESGIVGGRTDDPE